MNRNLLLFGPLAAVAFFGAVYVLAAFLPEYSHVSQTVSEIGEIGSPVQRPFQIAMLLVNALVVLLAAGLFHFTRANSVSIAPTLCVVWFGLAGAGANLFPSPHTLHNVFGLSLTIGYLAPLVLAIAWRRQRALRSVVTFSWVVAALLFVSIFLNISPAFNRDLYPLEYYGVIQRSALVLIYGWFAFIGLRGLTLAERWSDEDLVEHTESATWRV